MTEIITDPVHHNTIQDAAVEMAKEHLDTLAHIISTYKGLPVYYVLFHIPLNPAEHSNILHERVVIIARPPRPLQQGTVLYKVDRNRGTYHKIGQWLPEQLAPDELIDSRDNNIQDLYDSVKYSGIPLSIFQEH